MVTNMSFMVRDFTELQSELGIEGMDEKFDNGEYVDINGVVRNYFPEISETTESHLTEIVSHALILTERCMEAQKRRTISLIPVRDMMVQRLEEKLETNEIIEDKNKALETLFYSHMIILEHFGFDLTSKKDYVFNRSRV